MICCEIETVYSFLELVASSMMEDNGMLRYKDCVEVASQTSNTYSGISIRSFFHVLLFR